MKLKIIFILISSVILAISSFVMKIIKKEDKENGLDINEDEYGIMKALRLPINQDKRIEKETRDRDYPVNEKLWKKSFLVLLISSFIALALGYINHADIAGPVIIIGITSYVYLKKNYIVLIAADIFSLLLIILTRVSYSFPLMIILPVLLIFTVIVRRDYKIYRNSLKNK